jgi:DNA-directed RNA polymerase subunit RPC12/RpoP
MTKQITTDRPEQICSACGDSVRVDRIASHQAKRCPKLWPHCPDCGQKIASQDFASHQKTRCPSRNAEHSSIRVPISPPPSQVAAVARRASLNSPRVPTKGHLPLILYAKPRSKCHGARCLIVRSRDGGMVSRNCIECGIPEYIRLEDFPEVKCSRCNVRFKVSLADGMNYFFVCSSCGKQMMIAKIVPAWSDKFPHHGLAAYGDKIFAI